MFTVVALSIACLGLLGLITFISEKRTKEISLRKVLGASIGAILSLLSRELIALVLIGIFIGAPFGWFFMNEWLSNFFYRVAVPVSFILISGAAVLALALVIVWTHGLRASLNNPARNLRSE